jgi:hypothetical protein
MFNEKIRAENLLQLGFDKNLSLTRSMFLLAKYFKYCGVEVNKAKEKILDWLSIQHRHLRYEDAIKKIESILNDAYTKDYKFIDDISVDIWLSELIEIDKCTTRKSKMVMLSLLYLSKIYNDDDGIFYSSFPVLTMLSTMQKSSIQDTINKLEEDGMIEIIERDKIRKIFQFKTSYSDKTKVYKYPNKYRVLITARNNHVKNVKIGSNILENKIIYTIKDVNCLESDFKNIYRIMIEDYGLNTTRRLKKYVMDV